MSYILIINELIGVVIALISGIFTYRYLNSFLKILFFQLVSYSVLYSMIHIGQYIGFIYYTQWIYNLEMPIEFGFLCWAGYEYFKLSKERFLIWIGYLFFLLVFIIETMLRGLNALSNFSYIVGSVVVASIFLVILYSSIMKDSINWKQKPEIWVGLGLILYFVGIIPYLSLLHYLQETHPRINLYLYRFITIGLCNIRYLLLAYAFWLVRINTTLKTSVENDKH